MYCFGEYVRWSHTLELTCHRPQTESQRQRRQPTSSHTLELTCHRPQTESQRQRRQLTSLDLPTPGRHELNLHNAEYLIRSLQASIFKTMDVVCELDHSI
eukprot:Blabericola_migrator_1__11344@NODE_6705_length_482_cov_20_192771_g4639_i0_p1_GENE_NODE_6705_length_482_cov_20_192771_g4639_i0NODE_6705_length_482_cov_20_192771_g4639_i0_p1_ORF_typecomplete_len100_score9_34DUF2072/PF09845_9/0_06FixH/PF05751_11/0_22_NODE_6705_length_482_cov_20_192771_g4639_i030329